MEENYGREEDRKKIGTKAVETGMRERIREIRRGDKRAVERRERERDRR